MKLAKPILLYAAFSSVLFMVASAGTISVAPHGLAGCGILGFNDTVGQSCIAQNAFLSFTGSAYAQGSGPTDLHASSSSLFSPNLSSPFGGEAGAIADANYVATLTGGPAIGFLDIFVLVDGTLSLSTTTGDAGDMASESIFASTNNGSFPSFGSSLSGNLGFISVMQTVRVAFSQAQMTINLNLQTYTRCANVTGAITQSSCSAIADFKNTGTLAGINVLDSNRNPVYGASIALDSGQVFQTATPEPSSLILFGSGLAGVFLAWRFKSRREKSPLQIKL